MNEDFNLIKKHFLIIPSRPTPNGALHLGHLAGPYLRADILCRHLNRLGHNAKIISGSDVYDSYVLGKAVAENSTPDAIVNKYHQLIMEDLRLMDIDVCAYVNILDEKYKQQFEDINEAMIDFLHKQNAIMKVSENFLVSDKNIPILGCWIKGKCPYCSEKVGGFFCERCGSHFKPEQIMHPRPSLDWLYTVRNVECAYLKNDFPQHIINALMKKNIPAQYVEIVKEHIKRNQGLFRLTHPGFWGVKCQNHSEQVLFSPASIINYCLLYGQEYCRQTGTSINPFLSESSVCTVATFGKDAAIPYLYGSINLSLMMPQFRTFDKFFINEFYNLEGTKFSTSLNHAVWIKDFINKLNNDSDMVRYYLSLVDLNRTGNGFYFSDFLAFVNGEYHELRVSLKEILSNLENNKDCINKESPLIVDVQHKLSLQNEFIFKSADFEAHKALNIVREWLQLKESLSTPNDYYWWLKGFCLLAYPFIPKLTTKIWRMLSTDASFPRWECFTETAI